MVSWWFNFDPYPCNLKPGSQNKRHSKQPISGRKALEVQAACGLQALTQGSAFDSLDGVRKAWLKTREAGASKKLWAQQGRLASRCTTR